MTIMSACTLVLENMEFRAFHGCYPLERTVGGRFLVTLVAQAEIGQAAELDELDGTVNYLELYGEVKRQMERPSNTIENVAGRIVDAVKERFPEIFSAKVTVSKLAPPLRGKVEKVSVTIGE